MESQDSSKAKLGKSLSSNKSFLSVDYCNSNPSKSTQVWCIQQAVIIIIYISNRLFISEVAFKLMWELLHISLGLGLIILQRPDGQTPPRDWGHGVCIMGHQLPDPDLSTIKCVVWWRCSRLFVEHLLWPHLWTQNQKCSTENLKHLWLELCWTPLILCS